MILFQQSRPTISGRISASFAAFNSVVIFRRVSLYRFHEIWNLNAQFPIILAFDIKESVVENPSFNGKDRFSLNSSTILILN